MSRIFSVGAKPMHKLLALLSLWTIACYLLFKVHPEDQILESESSQEYIRRELLQKFSQSGAHVPSSLASLANTERMSSTVPSTSTNFLNVLQAEIAIDESPDPSESQLFKELQVQLPNLPIVYLQENKNKKWHLQNQSSSCAQFPTLLDLHFNNIYWQEAETNNGTFFLYGAYLDVRKNNKLGPTIRVLTMINRIEPTVSTYCQLWFKGLTEPVISKVLEYKYIWYRKWGNYKNGLFQPYLLACQIPKSHWKNEPVSVSIVQNICDVPTNNLRVIYNKRQRGEKKHGFAVCVKGLDFPKSDLSVKLTEWIELLILLGAHKIFLYSLEVHSNVTKVLNAYVEKGFVDLTQISLPAYQPNIPNLQHIYLKSKLNNKRQNELIPYNDCLYRNMYTYEYIALLDIDEVILPKVHLNWGDMMKEALRAASSSKGKNIARASYNFRNVYFLDEMLSAHGGPSKDTPSYLHMMQHIYRSANYTKPNQYVKCFHNPEKVLILHNHFPLGCLGDCSSYPVDTDLAHLAHYRSDCVSTLRKSCERDYKSVSVIDTTIWKWKNEVIDRTTGVLSSLGFFKPFKNNGSLLS